MNRPERLNAFDTAMAEGWADVVARAVRDPDVNVIVIMGEGRSFCAGGDVFAMDGCSGAQVEALASIIVVM